MTIEQARKLGEVLGACTVVAVIATIGVGIGFKHGWAECAGTIFGLTSLYSIEQRLKELVRK